MTAAEPGPLKVLFMGSPEFAVPSLRALRQRHEIVAVVTQPDRARGRGRLVAPPPVKVAAQELGLDVLQPERVRRRMVREQLAELGADVFVIVAFGQILSRRLLAVPPLGCVNVHASLLPRYRGPAPIQWAVIAGEQESGITVMQMDVGVDTGPILLQESLRLREGETAGSLHDRLAPLGARLLLRALDGLRAGSIRPRAQDDSLATNARMLSKADGRVDLTHDAGRVDCLIRGMDPWPGAFAMFMDQPIKLFCSHVEQGNGRPGEVLAVDERGMLVACGQGAVSVSELQLPGRRRLSAKAVQAGSALTPGTLLQ